VTPSCTNLMSRLLDPDPDLRISVKEALQHPWITAAPTPAAHQVRPMHLQQTLVLLMHACCASCVQMDMVHSELT
jgi:serine/threonine protein kinase